MSFIYKHTCRLCNSSELDEVLCLCPTPLANEFLSDPILSLNQDKYDLNLMMCKSCGHVQLSIVVSPDRLFRNYVYVSGTSPKFVKHFEDYAISLITDVNLEPNDLVVDIGSNDGTFLSFFKKEKMRTVGVDPAFDIADNATRSGIKTIPDFFNEKVVNDIINEYGNASLVTANNVFAHADDLTDIASNIHKLLSDDGVFVFEVQYFPRMCEDMLFDMIYHEHVSYHHVGPLINFFASIGMSLYDVKEVPTHGGSIRCFVDKGIRMVRPSVSILCGRELALGLTVPGILNTKLDDPLKTMGDRLSSLKTKIKKRLDYYKDWDSDIAGFGAPAKATTLMHYFDIDNSYIKYVIDDNPLKQNLYIPGRGIPIVPFSHLGKNSPVCLFILAWNFSESIIDKCKDYRNSGGRFMVPLPNYLEIK